jgi:hypothetical protein
MQNEQELKWHNTVGMSVLESLKNTIIITFSILDLLIISFTGFLGLTLGNIGVLFLLLGQVTVVPMLVLIGQAAFKGIIPASSLTQNTILASDPVTGDPYPVGSNVPTFWLANVMFFLGYVLGNASKAWQLTTQLSTLPGNSWFVDAQKTRSVTVTVTTIGLIIATAIARSRTGFENSAGAVLLTTVVFAGLGVGWYWIASMCGARYADIFGMATQPVVAFGDSDKPTTCIYTPKS